MLNKNLYYLFATSITFLVIAVILSLGFVNKEQPVDAKIEVIENKLAGELKVLQKEVVPILEVLEQNERFYFSKFGQFEYPFYVFRNGQLIYWSDYRFVPDYRNLRGDYKLKIVRTLRKDFLSRRWAVNNSDLEVFGVISLQNNYKIDNNYVQSGCNPKIFGESDLKILDKGDAGGHQICLAKENCLFKVSFPNDYVHTNARINTITFILYVIGGLLLAIFIIQLTTRLARNNVEMGFLILCLFLVGLRAVMLSLNFPEGLITSSLFDSRQFASSKFNSSLGDLYLNIISLLLLVLYIFRFYHRSYFIRYLLRTQGWKRKVASILVAALLFVVFHYQYLVFQTIYHNSHLTYDINQTIRFNEHRIIAFCIFITNTVIVFFAFHVLFRLYQQLSISTRERLYNFCLGFVFFSVVNLIIGQQFVQALTVTALMFMLLMATDLPRSLIKLRYRTFLYFFTGIIASSIIGAFAIYEFEHERELETKFKFANQFLIENDNLAEYLLSEANENIRKDMFIQSRMSSPFMSKDIVKSKIRQVYLSNYFDKYDVQIYLFNANGQPIEGAPDIIMPGQIHNFNVAEFKTPYPGIYFINKFGANASKRYLDFIEIRKRGMVVGYIILDLKMKRIIPDNVYPELLVDNRFLVPYQNSNYSYAVYNDSTIVYHSGDFNYIIDFDEKLLQQEELFEDGMNGPDQYRHVAVRDQRGRVIVISSNNHPFSDVISNFSFLFLIQVLTILILAAGYALYFSFQHVNLNYSAKIQLYLNGAFFLPLFAVSITTLSLINSSFKNEVNEEFYRKAESISTNISDDLDNFVNNVQADREDLPNKLAEISKFAGVDVNLFSVSGRLLATSQPRIYENLLLARFINPAAYGKIKEQGENAYVTKESVGELQFNTTYYGVKSFDTGQLVGIISIPFFQSEYELEQNQIEVLTNVINIFSFIFIIFLIISFLAARWLTFPLVFITQKLKKTTLTGFNEPLTWTTDDEIGLMVGEYNRMLINLEESKKALARSEKESAWRAIAQQVAHEIKNPLTPMKLTLQHLSRRLTGKHKDEELEKPINSLLQQVDTLNDIASSFSSFAKMPIPENELYEFSSVVRNTVNLYRSTQDVSFKLQLPADPVYTIGDEQLMGRIISNIIINSVQAKEEDSPLNIEVTLSVIQGIKLLLEIKDSGPGIDEAIHSKIFMPDFSTKQSGSGIGLAIAKHGIEHAGGKIWFETESEVGTSFFIELPMVLQSG